MRCIFIKLFFLPGLLLAAWQQLAFTQPLVFANGNLSTGNQTSNFITAPPGYTWSEAQYPNITNGYNSAIANNVTLADDFTVPAGQQWNISQIEFFAYSTGYTDTLIFPFNDVRIRIFDTDPTTGDPAPIVGNLTTNRFTSAASARIYRVSNNNVNLSRLIWSVKCNLPTSLRPGNYWIEWQLGTISGVTSNFTPLNTIVGTFTQPDYNAWQHNLTAGSWTPVTDANSALRQDIHFKIYYTRQFETPCTGIPAPGNTVATPANVCSGQNFKLSLSNDPFVTGLTYQWQISSNNSAWTDIPGANAKTFITSQNSAAYYRAKVACGTDTSLSASKQVVMHTSSVQTHPASVTVECSQAALFRYVKGGTSPVSAYQWQQRTSAAATWSNLGNSSTIKGTDDDTLNLLMPASSMNGYQYRCISTDICGKKDTTNPATLTVTNLTPRISPASLSICAGQVRSLSLTNRITRIATASSGSVNLTIPDSSRFGVTSSVNMSGIPTDAIISAISVRVNISHTWVGELAIALKAPNGKVLNLDYYLGSTLGNSASSGFSNTIFSSNGINAIVNGSNPYSGFFKADAVITSPMGLISGPVGMPPDVNNWQALYSQPNGSWSLGIVDAYDQEVGTLSSWSIDITYSAITAGTWTSSVANSIFSDSLTTTPYVSGSNLNKIFVKPLSTAVFTASLSNTNCTATPANVTVNVSGSDVLFTQDTVNICDTTYLLSAPAGYVSYNWNTGSTQRTILVNSSGSYRCTVSNGQCLSFDSIIIRMGSKNLSSNVIACDRFNWHGNVYTANGTYTRSFSFDSCTATDTIRLTIRSGTYTSTTQSACESYTWKGTVFTTSGIYTFRYNNTNGCPSTDTLKLTIRNGNFNTETRSACDSYSWNGTLYTASGTYSRNYTNTAGCPSTDTLKLTIIKTRNRETQSACNSYLWRGTTYTASGTYVYSYTNSLGCASIDTLVLTIKRGTYNSETRSACNSYAWNQAIYSASGTYIYDYINAEGCLSVDTLKLTINRGSFNVNTVSACNRYTWFGNTYTTSGTYTRNYNNTFGCASVDTLKLTIRNSTYNVTVQTVCDSLLWNGTIYRQTGTYTYNYVNGNNCPSTDTLKLTKVTGSNSFSAIACESYTWNGTTYRSSGIYTALVSYSGGCSFVDTLRLTIKYGTRRVFTESRCNNYTWNGNTYTSSGTYTYNWVNSDGCASTDTLKLTIRTSTYNVVVQSACESYVWNGVTYTTSGVYTRNYNNAAGCPSTDTLKLTILRGTRTSVTQSACSSYVWNGTTYTSSGVYIRNYLNGSGCPSTDTLRLSIFTNTYTVTNQSACDSFVWRGGVYRVSGTYVVNYTNSGGCPSADTLKLIIRAGTRNVTTASACDSYFWNGTTYTTGGTYVYTYTNSLGCPSTDTLKLSLGYNSRRAIYDTACNIYNWRGTNYTTSGRYIKSYTTPEGCFGIDTLYLTIRNSSYSSNTVSACNSYTWFGNVYTVSGIYVRNYTNSSGCPSADTLKLTVRYSTYNSTSFTGCSRYTWFGNVYTSSGTYIRNYSNAAGCLSTDTLYLTLNGVNNWTGSVSNAWENTANWSCGTIPDANTTVQVASGLTNYPVIRSQAVCKKIITENGASVIVGEGFRLSVLGR